MILKDTGSEVYVHLNVPADAIVSREMVEALDVDLDPESGLSVGA